MTAGVIAAVDTELRYCGRAPRSRVMWGGRVRRFNQATWHGAVVLNLSMTGALLELSCRTEVGEWLVVEIESPTGAGGLTLFTRCAVVVRNRRAPSTVVAVGFAPAKAQPAAIPHPQNLFVESQRHG